MTPAEERLPWIYLKPGEMKKSEVPAVISTVLGSCVSITMYVPGRKIGSICHALLPECRMEKGCTGPSSCREPYKFVDCSLDLMLKDMERIRVSRGEIELKLFGGADMFEVRSGRTSVSVGSKNVETAFAEIEKAGMKIKSYDVGGDRGRKILYYPHTGDVLLKRLNPSQVPPDVIKATENVKDRLR